MRKHLTYIVVQVFATIGGIASLVPAQPANTQTNVSTGKVQPWAKGVSSENRDKAQRLYRAGNTLFGELEYTSALTLYRRALESWDHPKIHANLAICLDEMLRPLEAHHHVLAAMEYGEAPFGKDRFSNLRELRESLHKRLARLRVACQEPGTKVQLDGRKLLSCPGETEDITHAGRTPTSSQQGNVPDRDQIVGAPRRGHTRSRAYD